MRSTHLPRALARPPRAAQIAAQEVGFGLKFSAAATLDIEEHPKGIPPEPGPGESAYASGSGGVRRAQPATHMNARPERPRENTRIVVLGGF